MHTRKKQGGRGMEDDLSPQPDVLREDMAAIAWLLTAAKKHLSENLRCTPPPTHLPPRPRRTRKQTKQALKEREEQRHARDVRYQADNE